MPTLMDRKRNRLNILETALRTLNPTAVLDRGYAIVMHGGSVIRRAEAREPGDQVHIRLASGALEADVTAALQEDRLS